MIASALDVGEAAIMSAVVYSTIHLVTAQRFSTLVGAQRVPCSSVQALRRRRDSLRVDKKIHASRCNLGVRWVFFDLTVGAIAFTRQALSGRAMETFMGSILFQCMQPRQLQVGGDARVSMDSALVARADTGDSA